MVDRYQEKTYDIVVVGGGMSGVCAAIAAARHGAKVAIVQARSMYGGNASSEIRMHIVGASCHLAKSNANETGILLEILLENKWRNPRHCYPVWDTVVWEKVNFQENLDSYLNTTMDSAVTQDDRITSIHCYQQTTEIHYTFKAKIFIDATGHGTLGFKAGAEYRIGSESTYEFGEPNAPEEANNVTMGNTIMFQAVDLGHPVEFKKPFWAHTLTEEDLKYRKHYNMTTAMADMGVDSEFSEGELKALPEFTRVDSGYWWIEVGGDSDDIIGNGEAIRDELLAYVYGVWDHIKNCGDHGAQNYELSWVGIVPGYRESRRLVGDYLLTEQDVRANRIFEDAVAYGGWPMDEHVKGGVKATDKLPARILNFDGLYTVPYRCYLSKNIKNLMMAGRDISTSKMAFGTLRVMATCAVGGQAVGTAAALAIGHGVDPRLMLDHIGELQQTLIADDCYLPGFVNTDSNDIAKRASISASSSTAGHEPALVVNGLTRIIGNQDNFWESLPLKAGPQTISLQLADAANVQEVRLLFDPNLSREIMPSITSTVRDRQPKEMPEELVRDYSVVLLLNGVVQRKVEVKANYQRQRIHAFAGPVKADTVQVVVSATHGHPGARIFEVRIY